MKQITILVLILFAGIGAAQERYYQTGQDSNWVMITTTKCSSGVVSTDSVKAVGKNLFITATGSLKKIVMTADSLIFNGISKFFHLSIYDSSQTVTGYVKGDTAKFSVYQNKNSNDTVNTGTVKANTFTAASGSNTNIGHSGDSTVNKGEILKSSRLIADSVMAVKFSAAAGKNVELGRSGLDTSRLRGAIFQIYPKTITQQFTEWPIIIQYAFGVMVSTGDSLFFPFSGTSTNGFWRLSIPAQSNGGTTVLDSVYVNAYYVAGDSAIFTIMHRAAGAVAWATDVGPIKVTGASAYTTKQLLTSDLTMVPGCDYIIKVTPLDVAVAANVKNYPGRAVGHTE